jgi:peptidoglycan hydrolase-like protein with peptidoglycan-binding domain
MMRSLAHAATAAFALAMPSAALASNGQQLWSQAGCGGCHTLAAAGASGQVGPNLDQLRPSGAAVAEQVTSGGGGMPSFASSLSAGQIQALAAWVSSSAGGSSTQASSVTLKLQHSLAKLGFFHGPFTGFYGPLTTAAVKRFQRSVGLHVDGVWGPLSAAALQRRLSAVS